MDSKSKVKEAVNWYIKNRFIYEAICKKVEIILEDVLNTRKINYHSITSRAKSIESYRFKASKPRYKDPRSEIKDMAGIRVITYTETDAKMVFELIKSTFFIYPNTTSDKAEKLGYDRLGYHSFDCLASLGDVRLRLPEYSIFKDVPFEIQVRTILQHAWAEFEHDRNYKFSVQLPDDLKHRLFLIEGNLETVDREFDDLSKAIDAYRLDVENKIDVGSLDIQVSSLSLIPYLNEKFKRLIDAGLVAPEIGQAGDRVFEELKEMEITTLKKLDMAIPEDFCERAKPHYQKDTEVCGPLPFYPILIDIFIISNSELYFNKVWKNSWQGISEESVKLYESYGIEFRKLAYKYNLDITPF